MILAPGLAASCKALSAGLDFQTAAQLAIEQTSGVLKDIGLCVSHTLEGGLKYLPDMYLSRWTQGHELVQRAVLENGVQQAITGAEATKEAFESFTSMGIGN